MGPNLTPGWLLCDFARFSLSTCKSQWLDVAQNVGDVPSVPLRRPLMMTERCISLMCAAVIDRRVASEL